MLYRIMYMCTDRLFQSRESFSRRASIALSSEQAMGAKHRTQMWLVQGCLLCEQQNG
jgi:hypothetical protein